MRQTTIIKPADVKQKWYIIDAEDQVLGRLSVFIADRLRGKNKPDFTSHINTGDCIVVINADKVRLTANKENDKMYYSYSGYPGGMKSINAKLLRKKRPTDLIRLAVKGMLPKNKLGAQQLCCLHLFVGTEHDKQAQKPEKLEVK